MLRIPRNKKINSEINCRNNSKIINKLEKLKINRNRNRNKTIIQE